MFDGNTDESKTYSPGSSWTSSSPHHAAARVGAQAGGAEQVRGDEVDEARVVGQGEEGLDLAGRENAGRPCTPGITSRAGLRTSAAPGA